MEKNVQNESFLVGLRTEGRVASVLPQTVICLARGFP